METVPATTITSLATSPPALAATTTTAAPASAPAPAPTTVTVMSAPPLVASPMQTMTATMATTTLSATPTVLAPTQMSTTALTKPSVVSQLPTLTTRLLPTITNSVLPTSPVLMREEGGGVSMASIVGIIGGTFGSTSLFCLFLFCLLKQAKKRRQNRKSRWTPDPTGIYRSTLVRNIPQMQDASPNTLPRSLITPTLFREDSFCNANYSVPLGCLTSFKNAEMDQLNNATDEIEVTAESAIAISEHSGLHGLAEPSTSGLIPLQPPPLLLTEADIEAGWGSDFSDD